MYCNNNTLSSSCNSFRRTRSRINRVCWFPIGTGQTGLTRNQKKKSKKCSRRRSRQARASAESTSSSDVDHKCLMAEINEMAKEDEVQIEAIKALNQELEEIKQENASLAQRYHELSNDYTNATKSVIRVASLEKENQMLKAQVVSLTSKLVALQGTHKELEHSYEKLADHMLC